MDKLKYALKLNNVIFTRQAETAVAERLLCDKAEKKQKKRRGTLAVLALVTGSIVFFVLTVALTFILVYRRPTGSLTPIDPGVVPADDVILVEDSDSENISLPRWAMSGSYEYDLLAETVARVKMTADGEFIAASDHVNLSKYFNVDYMTTDSLCRTMFAGYDGNLFLFDPNTYAVPDGYEKYDHKEHGKYYDRNSAKADFKSSYMTINGVTAGTAEVIALSASHGTFRYLLTFTFLYPAATSSTPAPVYTTEIPEKTFLYNETGEEIGYYDGQSYTIKKEKLNTVKVTIYKVRCENGIPVIYDCRVVSPDEYDSEPVTYSGSRMQTTGFESFTPISTTDAMRPADIITGAAFGYNGYLIKFDNSVRSSSLLKGGSSLSEFPYSVPDCRGSGLISNSELCTIINAYDLQWFFPEYVYEDDQGQKTVIGSAITKQITNYDTLSPLSSALYPLIGGDNDNGKICDYITGEPIYPYYDPYACDKPYFSNKSALNALTLFKVTIAGNEFSGPEKIDELSEELYFAEQTEIPTYLAEVDIPYIQIREFVLQYPTTPYSVYTAPFSSEYECDNYLLYKLGLKTPAIKYIDTTDFYPAFTVGKKMRLTGISDKEKTVIGGNTYDKSTVFVYEASDKYMFDANGVTCAYISDGRVYYFNTFTPEFRITVISDNGTLLYIGAGDFRYIDSDATETDPFEMTPSGLTLGAYMYAQYLRNRATAPIYDVKYDNDKVYVCAYIYNEPMFFINYGKRKEYYYKGGFIRTVYENKTEWQRIIGGNAPYYAVYEMSYDGYGLIIECSDVRQEETDGYSK